MPPERAFEDDRGPWFARPRYLLALALLLSFLAFVGTLRFDFVYDDIPQIVHNPLVQSWGNAPHYFTEHVWAQRYPNQPGDYYRPLFLLWLLINHSLFGLKPAGWHLMAVLLHVLTTALVYQLARKLGLDAMAAALAALVFGLHPVHIEAVAWVSGATEPLMAAPMLGALLCYIQQREKPRQWRRAVAALSLFAIALLVKETAIVLPLVLCAYQWWFRHGEGRETPLGKRMVALAPSLAPFLLLSALYLVVRVRVLMGFGRPNQTPLRDVLLTWPSLLWFYLRQMLWPFRTSAFYDLAWVHSPGWRNFVLPLLIVVAAAVGLWLWARRSRPVSFAAVWLVATLLPPLWGVRYFGEYRLAHDRYLYIPSVALVLLLAVALGKLCAGARVFRQPAWQAIAVLLLAGVLGASTAAQSVYWKDNLALYSRAVQVAPRNVFAWVRLGTEWLARGNGDLAMAIYHHALQLAPDDWETNFALGIASSERGNLTDAERFLTRACELRPAYANQFYYLGLLRLRMGKLAEAEQSLRRAVQLWPQAVGYHQALGVVLEKEGNLFGARDEYRAELAGNPNSDARRQLAAVEARLEAARKVTAQRP